MSWSKKTSDDLCALAESSMRWGNGEVVVAYLDWDERLYYLWFEPQSGYEDWCEAALKEGNDGPMQMLNELRKELANIGVQTFCLLESVNSYCKDKCGSDDPYDCAEFYEDEFCGICGA